MNAALESAPREVVPLARHPLATAAGAAPARSERSPVLNGLDWRQAVGGALVALGTLAILLAWWNISGTPYPGEQMPPLASGGIGGAALIAIGVLLLNSFEHVKDREALAEVLLRLDEAEARQAATEQRLLDDLRRMAESTAAAGATTPAAATARRRAPSAARRVAGGSTSRGRTQEGSA